MPTLAGQMSNAAQPNAQWLAADGKPYYVLDPKQSVRTAIPSTASKGTRQDYIRRVGWQGRRRGLGPLGWIICMPVSAGYKVTTADDNVEANLTNPPTVAAPPAGTK